MRSAFEIEGREVALALVHEAVAGEVDEDAVVLFGDAGKPGIDLAAEVGEGGFVVGQHVHVFDAEVAAFGADERGEDGLGVAFGEVELLFVGEVAVVRDADDDGVADGDLYGFWGRGDGIELLDLEIALLGCGWAKAAEGQGRRRSPSSRGWAGERTLAQLARQEKWGGAWRVTCGPGGTRRLPGR